jgi:biopolymer transport protein TolR
MHTGKSEINVTPLIDVLLVLLIIFMVITPLLPRGLAASVPTKSADNSPAERPIVLQISTNGLSINNNPVSSDTLAAAIRSLYASRANKVLFVNADKDLEYRQVAQLIDRVKGVSSDIQVGLMP